MFYSDDQHTMKITIICHCYPPHLGGLEIVAWNHATRLASMGHEVAVITSNIDQSKKECITGNLRICSIFALNLFEQWGIPFPIFSPRLLTVLNKEIKNTDVVHIHDAFYMSSFFGALFALLHKKPIVLMQHVEFVYHPNKLVLFIQKIVYSTVGILVFRLSSLVLTYNTRVQKFLLKQKVLSERITLFPNGVDTQLFHPASSEEKQEIRVKYNISPNKKVVLFVGRLVAKKGYEKLLAAHSQKYQIVLVGGDKSSKSASSDILFLGKISQEQTAEVYRAADIFALPSVSEGFPLSIQEAMASGLPIVTTYDKGYEFYNFNHNKFFLLKDPSCNELKMTLETIVSDEIKMQEMSEYSRQYCLDHFNWFIVMTKLVSLYQDVIDKKKRAK